MTWRAAVREATYQYKASVHLSTGFSPNLLHLGFEVSSPGLLHLDDIPAAPPPTAHANRLKFFNQLREMQELIKGVVACNQGEAHRRAAKYYLMRVVLLPANSWVWVNNPWASPPEGDELQNHKLAVECAGPYLFEGMASPLMARVAKVDGEGKMICQFQVHGPKVRLCQVGGQTIEKLRQLTIQPGRLPDFPDSEVSGPLYQLKKPKISVHPNDERPQTEVQDEALRREFREESHALKAPRWIQVEDAMMQDVEPEDDYKWKVTEWL